MTDFRRKKVTDFRHALAMTGELGAVEWSVCTRNDGRKKVTDFRRKKVTDSRGVQTKRKERSLKI